jgi:hypothetical protein
MSSVDFTLGMPIYASNKTGLPPKISPGIGKKS